MNASMASGVEDRAGPKRVVAFLSPLPTVTTTPLPKVALVFLPARIVTKVSTVVASFVFLATDAGLSGSIVALPPVTGRIVKFFVDRDAGVLGVGVDRGLLVAGDVDRPGVELAFLDVGAVDVPADFAARLDGQRDRPLAHHLLRLMGQRQRVGPLFGSPVSCLPSGSTARNQRTVASLSNDEIRNDRRLRRDVVGLRVMDSRLRTGVDRREFDRRLAGLVVAASA